MSTRCNIEIYDYDLPDTHNALLYHHSDGYPEFMRGKLERFLKAAYKKLKDIGREYWWDAERVAAVMLLLSVEDYREPMEPGARVSGGRPDNRASSRSATPRPRPRPRKRSTRHRCASVWRGRRCSSMPVRYWSSLALSSSSRATSAPSVV